MAHKHFIYPFTLFSKCLGCSFYVTLLTSLILCVYATWIAYRKKRWHDRNFSISTHQKHLKFAVNLCSRRTTISMGILMLRRKLLTFLPSINSHNWSVAEPTQYNVPLKQENTNILKKLIRESQLERNKQLINHIVPYF